MCTSLLYRDARDRFYLGRTLELSIDLPYQVAVFPAGMDLSSEISGHPAFTWKTRHLFVAVTMPAAPPSGAGFGSADLKVIEGLNDAGLTYSVQSYPLAAGPQAEIAADRAVLSVVDLGAWILGQFATVADAKAALAAQPVRLQPVPLLGGVEMPFHYAVHDVTGASLIIEFHRGVLHVYDNPVGVMTNGPQFPWHLTNLDNYTFLDNVDRSKSTFGAYQAVQPDMGIAKAGLPASDTSVDRFVRAAFYAQYAEKQADPDQAIRMVAHIMNNFDRPRGISIDHPNGHGEHLQIAGQAHPEVASEFTCWTSLSDLTRRLFFVRDSDGMSYTRIDVKALAAVGDFRVRPLSGIVPAVSDATAALQTH